MHARVCLQCEGSPADSIKDFNYHAHLYKTDNHPHRTPTSGGAGIGSGLNTLANYPWIDFSRMKWETCSEASGADCLTPKGFTMMRVRFDEGVYVDFYNLHADAGYVAGHSPFFNERANVF